MATPLAATVAASAQDFAAIGAVVSVAVPLATVVVTEPLGGQVAVPLSSLVFRAA